jgi:uncharacterized DUF497 family protein
MTLLYHFDWDASKARSNQRKHGVSFQLATSVFRDLQALTIYDDEHSDNEERWVTLGRAGDGRTLVVVHSSVQTLPTEIRVRIISARRADRDEIRDYEDVPR